MTEPIPSQPVPREAWAVLGFLAGLLVAGGTVTVTDLVTVSEAVCPEPAPAPVKPTEEAGGE